MGKNLFFANRVNTFIHVDGLTGKYGITVIERTNSLENATIAIVWFIWTMENCRFSFKNADFSVIYIIQHVITVYHYYCCLCFCFSWFNTFQKHLFNGQLNLLFLYNKKYDVTHRHKFTWNVNISLPIYGSGN